LNRFALCALRKKKANMAYGWKIELNGVDITSHISGFSITCSLTNFCREMNLDFADPDYYSSLDFSQISESPEIEIFTKNGATFYSQGKFFIERPALATAVNSEIMQGVWGRSQTAVLSEPFASKITKVWKSQTTFFAICEEMCDLAGFTWNSAYSDIDDFVIFPYTYEAENLYPIDVITELAMLAGAVVTTDRLGHLCIKKIDYSPSVADIILTDADISEILESPEWPAFANRVRITPIGSLGSYSINLHIPNRCLQADATSKRKVFARVTDPDGEPVNGLVVTWSHDGTSATMDYDKTNTQEILIQAEQQKADNFYTVKVDIPPSSVLGVWALADTARKTNFADGGYTIDGNTITLTNKLTYCDQTVVVSYFAQGIAVNYIQAGFIAEDVTITADLEGQQDTGIVYIGNQCQCPPTIKLSAAPSSIQVGSKSTLLVYVEEGGPVTTGRTVYLSDVSKLKKGSLRWSHATLGAVSISKEKTVVINEVAGLTQCELSMYPASVTSIRRAENDEPGRPNLYSSHDGKLVTLNTYLASGIDLFAYYTAQGAAINTFTGSHIGETLLKASILSSREEGVSDQVTVTVTDKTNPAGTAPADQEDDDDDGGWGGLDDADEDTYDPTTEDPATEQADYNWCVPDKGTTGDRFATALEHDCDCELLCNEEFDIYGTTQGYDEGSGRNISDLAVEQCACEEGSPEYWEKYAELKAEALAHCQGQCECAEGMEWDTVNNPETIVKGSSVTLYVTGGRGPYQWSVSGNGYSLLVSETEVGQNQITCVEGVCGVDYDATVSISVTDDCGDVVSGALRNVAGEWELIYECGMFNTPEYKEVTDGIYKYLQYWCTNCIPDVCGVTNCITNPGCTEFFSWDDTVPDNPGCPDAYTVCWIRGSKAWQWGCGE